MRQHLALILFVLLLNSSPASAFTKTAAELLSICETGDGEKVMCIAFVAGVIHGFVAAGEHIRISAGLDEVPKFMCRRDDWTAGQGYAIFVEWAARHEDLLDKQPESVILWAHRDAYPCN